MKYNDNGTYKDIYVKAFDTLPIGTEVDYDGQTVPDGWTEVADPNTYSTDEIDIGMKWIDDKPIYRKVIQTTMPNVTSASTAVDKYIDLNSYNIEQVINLKGVVNQTNSAGTDLYAQWTLPFVNPTASPALAVQLYYKWDYYSSAEGKNSINIRSNVSWLSNCNVFIIVEYTKIID